MTAEPASVVDYDARVIQTLVARAVTPSHPFPSEGR
jgi:hypothetical protein